MTTRRQKTNEDGQHNSILPRRCWHRRRPGNRASQLRPGIELEVTQRAALLLLICSKMYRLHEPPKLNLHEGGSLRPTTSYFQHTSESTSDDFNECSLGPLGEMLLGTALRDRTRLSQAYVHSYM